MKRLGLLLLLLSLPALATPPYRYGVAAGGNANPPAGDPTNPAFFPVTPYNLGGVAKYRIWVCAKSSQIQSGTLRLWMWSTTLKRWGENADYNATPNYTGDAFCGLVELPAGVQQGYMFPQLVNATQSSACTDTAGSPDCFTILVEG